MDTSQLKNYGTRIILELLEKHEKKEGLKKIQIALNKMGKKLLVDGIIGNITINAIKNVSNKKLHEVLYENKEIPEVTLVSKKKPSWIKLAYEELGVKEIKGKGGTNPRVEQYHDAVGIAWADDDVPWCGSFVGFIIKKAGKGKVKKAYRALSWLHYGKRISKPVLGAIAVKKRRGGGHVGFVVGQSKSGKYIYILGGNQNDAVNIKRYKKNIFTDFRVPSNYKDIYTLPIMRFSGSVNSEA